MRTTMQSRVKPVGAGLGFLAALLVGVASVSAADTTSDLILVLDASGSMWGQVAGEAKIVIARRVMKDLAGKIPAGTEVGLIAYGHRREGDCDDIESIVPIGPLDASALGTKIDTLNAKGKTPTTKAVQQAIDALKTRDRVSTVILVSDGIETCGGDPCAAVRAAKTAGVEFVMHVVGFDMGDADVSQLECAAQAAGGLYFDARNAEELAGALDDAIEAPTAEETPARLSVRATAAEALIDALVVVTPAGASERVAHGRTYTASETNPRIFPLAVGTYDVSIKAVRLKGEAEQRFAAVEVSDGKITELVADFSAGMLAVGVTRNGALSDATVNVYRAGTKERVAGGRTYRASTSNPRVLELTAGSYDVQVGSVEIKSGPIAEFSGVVVAGGQRTDLTHDYVSGTLKVGAVQGATLVDAVVAIRQPDTGKQIAGGRTYTADTTNPKAFELIPGTYSVRVAAVKLDGAPEETLEVTIVAGETVERTVTFP